MKMEQEKELEMLKARLAQCKVQVENQKEEKNKYATDFIELNTKVDEIKTKIKKIEEVLVLKNKLLSAKNFD